MSAAVTLFQLASDGATLFDGSVTGVPVTPSQSVKLVRTPAGASLSGGSVDIGRSPGLDGLQSFTVEALVTPSAIGTVRQTIIEGQNPPVAVYLDATGKLAGSVRTAAGLATIDSGGTVMKAGVAQRVTFARDAAGQLSLDIDGTRVGAGPSQGALQSAGALGLRIGMGLDSTAFAFQGSIAELAVRQGVVTQQTMNERVQEGLRLQKVVTDAGFLKNVVVSLLPDASHSRLQHVKDLMNAAGVQTLSDLDTLPVKQRTPLSAGQILVAPRKAKFATVNWGSLVASFRGSSVSAQRQVLATHLTNRNSTAYLQRMQTPAQTVPAQTVPVQTVPVQTGPVLGVPGGIATAPGVSPVLHPPIGNLGATAIRPGLGAAALQAAPTLTTRSATLAQTTALSRTAVSQTTVGQTAAQAVLAQPAAGVRASLVQRNIGDLISVSNNAVTRVDPALIDAIAADHPAFWPVLTPPPMQVMDLKTVPLNSAVVIAGTLDLTNEQLVVEPNVETLYIIAETVICGPGAAITWRRPGGSTPAAADNPDLNGRDFPGIQTKEDSRDGIRGGDGQPGSGATPGASGRNGPNIEMWVKSMTGLPNLDFNGEDGIAGGTGQRGGSGGRGGGGGAGKWAWFFGKFCCSDPGDGGDGGDGGRGADGGRGGSGGNGGNIKIGVLTGTLATTVVNQTFKIKNQGGAAAQGGGGGSGGSGGAGGRSGNGDVCHSGKDGHPGAQGQPGNQGQPGFNRGTDAQVSFFEFTQAAWDDLMTRPWITSITPPEAFPGDTMTIHGSRFTTADHAVVGTTTLPLTINADQSASVSLPLSLGGGLLNVFVRRADGIESNRVNLGIKPQLSLLPVTLAQGSTVTLGGQAFLAGAAVLFNGATIAANVANATSLSFPVPGTGGGGSAGGTVSVQVRNPDGRVSNTRAATQPRVLEVPFRYGQHNLSFPNFTQGLPDWGTYEDTFGTVEVMHEQLDPVFGHPLLTAAYFAFYTYFLKGKGHGGLATGFCTSLASLVADRFWLGKTDTPTVQLTDVQKMLTGVHGKLLSRQALLTFHDQGRQGISRVEQTFHEIEATFLRGTDRQNAPLLFFIPAGEVWDSGYVDKLSDSHCIMPYKFVYPVGRPAPQLTADGSSTLTDPDGVQLFCWDCNHPTSPNCRVQFRRTNNQICFDYIPDTAAPEFRAEDGITLGMMRHGDYMLADVDLPFSGPFGLTGFVIEFLLSPADLEVTDANGKRTGNFSGKIMAEIPGSHPAYLMTGMYLLPAATAMTRTVVGNGVGSYDYHSITPDGTSILLQGVPTQPGHRDVVSISADATQIRFTPAADKGFSLTVARMVNGQARAVAITGVAGAPDAAVDITLAPELNLLTVGNRGIARTVEVHALGVTKNGTPVNKSLTGIALPAASDLAITVADWNAVDLQAQAVAF